MYLIFFWSYSNLSLLSETFCLHFALQYSNFPSSYHHQSPQTYCAICWVISAFIYSMDVLFCETPFAMGSLDKRANNLFFIVPTRELHYTLTL